MFAKKILEISQALIFEYGPNVAEDVDEFVLNAGKFVCDSLNKLKEKAHLYCISKKLIKRICKVIFYILLAPFMVMVLYHSYKMLPYFIFYATGYVAFYMMFKLFQALINQFSDLLAYNK